jgi:hypothetical protein
MQNIIELNGNTLLVSDLSDSDKQDIGSTLVHREVYHCASQLISELSQDPNGSYIDQILEFSVSYQDRDASEVANENDWFNWEDYHQSDLFDSKDLESELSNFEFDLMDKSNLFYQVTSAGVIDIVQCDCYEDLCEDENLDLDSVDPIEALEFWIVSDWLANKLSNYGELVTTDFMGFCIWGRTCSGQAINLDHVIQSIAINSYSREGDL